MGELKLLYGSCLVLSQLPHLCLQGFYPYTDEIASLSRCNTGFAVVPCGFLSHADRADLVVEVDFSGPADWDSQEVVLEEVPSKGKDECPLFTSDKDTATRANLVEGDIVSHRSSPFGAVGLPSQSPPRRGLQRSAGQGQGCRVSASCRAGVRRGFRW